jgi:hypothetical protein
MATLTKGKTFSNGELVTPAALHSMVDSGTVTNIVNADISASAAIADTKLAQITTAGKVLPAAVQGTAVVTADPRLSDARPPTAHTHDDRYYTETEIDTKLSGLPVSSHTHTIANVTGLQTALDGKQASGSYAAASHTHDASAITSGTLANARTTATSANTANAIVARDASGDFLAGKINGLTVGMGGGSQVSNTAVGLQGLNANTSGYNNTAVGWSSLQSNTTGLHNTAIGANASASNTTGINNTAVGFQVLKNNTTGYLNTAIGANASASNTTGYLNTAIGVDAFFSNSTGYKNTALGYATLTLNTTGRHNVACGSQALYKNINGAYNHAGGSDALYNNTTGNYNVATGNTALFNNTNGSFNIATGADALYNNTTGSNNTAVGYSALVLNTSDNYSTGIGYQANVTGSNQVQLGNSTATTYAYGAVQDRSDIRDKADIRDTTLGLDFVNALRPVDFKWDMREDYRSEAPQAPDQDASQEAKVAYQTAKAKWLEDGKLANITRDGSKKRGRYHHGLIAQEVKSVLDSKGLDFGGYQDHSIKGGDDVLSIGYEELIAPMLKAIQELAARVAALEAR